MHYCVANMPGAVARTSTIALNNATLPFTLNLANKGYRQALLDDPHLGNGLNVHEGQLTCQAVAQALGLEYTPAARALEAELPSGPRAAPRPARIPGAGAQRVAPSAIARARVASGSRCSSSQPCRLSAITAESASIWPGSLLRQGI